MKKLITTTLATLTLAGCATAPMDESKPVHFTTGFWQAGYTQDGKFVNSGDAETKIGQVPEARSKLQSAAIWQIGGLVGEIAGFVIALTTPSADYNHFDNGRFYGGLFGGLAAATIGNVVANDKREDAAVLYNKAHFDITPKKTTSYFITPLKDGATAGVAFRF